jgi:hypothetical protein
MPKYRCTLDVDKEWVDNFNLVFNADNEQEAETEAMIEVKENLHDYITVYVDEEEKKEIDVQSNTKEQIQREKNRSKYSS